MYETEVNRHVEHAHHVPAEIRNAFRLSSVAIASRSVLPWGEHCTECVWPTCYTNCDMYLAREDGKCRRFADGMVRIEGVDNPSGYILRLRFKRWAKLWTIGNTRLFSVPEARAVEEEDLAIGKAIADLHDTSSLASRIVERYHEKKTWALQGLNVLDDKPEYFLLECYNPSPERVMLTLTIRPRKSPTRIPFEHQLFIQTGFNRCAVPMMDINRAVDTSQAFEVEITPNHREEALTLYFGLLDFVREHEPFHLQDSCKAVVWDLDNTIWDGTLAEDGVENVRLKEGMPEVIAELDGRGIVISAASKNDTDEARAALRRFDLEHYFVYPEFSWHPKSQGVARIAAHLNIGVSSIIFIDDSAFERGEVQHGCPGISVLDAAEYRFLLNRPELQVPHTDDSRRRRAFYQLQQAREDAQTKYDGDYLAFLRDSRIQLSVQRLSDASLERAHELTQRTQQLNFSGNRYSRQKLEAMVQADGCEAYVIEAKDKYGDYGTVGFCVLELSFCVITDLMFSCRIRSKRVEHAFLTYLLRRCRATRRGDVYLKYRPTSRNAHAVEALGEVGFEQVSRDEDTLLFIFRTNQEIRDEGVVMITDVVCRDPLPPF